MPSRVLLMVPSSIKALAKSLMLAACAAIEYKTSSMAFKGLKRAGISSTPSVAGTPLRGPGGGPGATPARTPIRDQLGLNDPEFAGSEASQREMRLREAAERDSLRSGLAGLPAPKNEYQVMVPEVPSHC